MLTVSALESSQHSFWLKLVQPANMRLEGVGEEAREEAGGGVRRAKRRGTVFACAMGRCGGGCVLLY